MKASELTQDIVKSLLHYNPDTGIFTRASGRCSGNITGVAGNNGYLTINLGGCIHSCHRLAWLYMTGSWPKACIDHINMVRSDNRFSNLRKASYTQNGCNIGKKSNNTSGVKGVHWNKPNSKWIASICIKRKRINLGSYADINDAAAAYRAGAIRYHGEFANAG